MFQYLAQLCFLLDDSKNSVVSFFVRVLSLDYYFAQIFFSEMFENQWSIIIRVLTVIQTLHKPNGFDAELQWKCSYCRFYCCKKAVTHVHSSHAFIKKIDLKTYSTYSASILLQLCTWIKFSLLSFEFISC